MDTRKENMIILGVFFMGLMGMVFMNLTPAQQPRQLRVSPTLKPGDTTAPVTEQPVEDRQKADREDESILSAWGRDPFDTGFFEEIEMTVSVPEAVAPAEEEPLIVSLVLISDAFRTATINGSIYKEGAVVEGEKIVEIRPDGIVAEKGGKTRFVPLGSGLKSKKGAIKITIEE